MSTPSCEELKSSFDALRNISVEAPVLQGTMSHFFFLIEAHYHAYLDRIGNNAGDGIALDGNELNNILQLAARSFAQLSSKTEVVEVVTKRQKAYDQIVQLEQQILSSFNPKFSLFFPSRNGLLANHATTTDIERSTDMLQNLKYYAERYNTEAFEDHVNTINALLEILQAQRSSTDIRIAHWPKEDLNATSMKEIGELFPERLSPLGVDDHNITEKALSKSYGTTYRCLWEGNFVAVKKINRRVYLDHEHRLRDTILALEDLANPSNASPYLLNLLGVSWDKDLSNIYLLFPLSPERSLFDAFTNPRLLPDHRVSLKPSQKVSILIDVAKAIDHLHRRGYVHGRIKDANILLYPDMRVKLGDFAVQQFLSHTVRLGLKGTHGVRWATPESIQQEVLCDSINSKARNNTMAPTLLQVAAQYPGTLSPSIDIYALGVLAVVLTTETMPFYNIPWDEGVRNQLLEGATPPLKARYRDQEVLRPLESNIVTPCLGKPYQRPFASSLIQYLEGLYCEILQAEHESTLQQYERDIAGVQQEIQDIAEKIAEHEILLLKGKEVIKKKEEEKFRAHESKVKREKDLEIDKARQKLVLFRQELEGLKEDKEGAESDLEHLLGLRDELREILGKGKRYPLKHREHFPNVDQETILDIYCDDIEYDRYEPQLTHRGVLIHAPKSNGTAWTPALLATSPFAHLYTMGSVPEFTNTDLDALRVAVNNKTFEYQHLVDHLDLMFRVPITTAAVSKYARRISLRLNGGVASPTMAKSSIGPSSAAIGGISISNAGAAGNSRYAASNQDVRLISTASEDTTTVFRPHRDSNDDEGLDSDDEPLEHYRSNSSRSIAAGDTRRSVSTSVTHQPRHHQTRDLAAISRERISSKVRASAMNFAEQINTKLIDLESYEVSITSGLVDGPDDFPSDDFDIIHVQYLAAANGVWNDAVGLRRLGQGFLDEHIAGFLDNRFTPVHLAAYLGNFDILMELVTAAELSAVGVDVNGDTPLHCACKRGHLRIARYLAEQHGLLPDQSNAARVTPIQYALKGGHLNIVAYFMEEAPRIITSDFVDAQFGASMLHWACLSSRPELIEYLTLHHHLNVEAVSAADQATPLLWASFASSKDVVKYLVEKASAHTNVKNAQQMGCLHMATMSGDVEKTLYLMDSLRLKLTDKDLNHQTPFDVAKGSAALFLQARKEKGFVTGSIAEKNRSS